MYIITFSSYSNKMYRYVSRPHINIISAHMMSHSIISCGNGRMNALIHFHRNSCASRVYYDIRAMDSVDQNNSVQRNQNVEGYERKHRR